MEHARTVEQEGEESLRKAWDDLNRKNTFESAENSPESVAEFLRRVSLDLTGTLPAPNEIEAFLADERDVAYQRMVDRVLASPHYGERWGRIWLDAARYADTDGYEKDKARPHAWRYRDWVIRAFNDNLPYDRFTVEQCVSW